MFINKIKFKSFLICCFCLILSLSVLPFGSFADPSESEYYIYSDSADSIEQSGVLYYKLKVVFPEYSDSESFITDSSEDPFFINGHKLTSVFYDGSFYDYGSFNASFGWGTNYTLLFFDDPSSVTSISPWIKIMFGTIVVYDNVSSYATIFKDFLGVSSNLIISGSSTTLYLYSDSPDLSVPIYRQSDLAEPLPDSPTASIFNVFSSVGDWIISSLDDMIPIFYGESGFTFIGLCVLIPLGMAVLFLLISIILSFLRFKS